MQQHGGKYFAAHPLPPSDPEDGVSRSKFIFLEHGHVA